MKVGDYEKSLIKSRLASASYSIKDDNLIEELTILLQQILTN
jgi:hypothetical protein